MGFIFYEKSKRFVGEKFPASITQAIPSDIQKVGVFVNAGNDYVLKKIHHYQLQAVQLHGDESVTDVQELWQKVGQQVDIIKVFSIKDTFDFTKLIPYQNYVHYFLFDTKGKDYGGNGIRFNWNVLDKYTLKTPFFLSGGISLAHIPQIKTLSHLPIHAIDVNSQFEEEPALKNVTLVKQLKAGIAQ